MNRVISAKTSLFVLSRGLLVSRSVNAARRTRASFERSKSYTCDFDSAPCLTMMTGLPMGKPLYPRTHYGGRPLRFMVSRVLSYKGLLVPECGQRALQHRLDA